MFNHCIPAARVEDPISFSRVPIPPIHCFVIPETVDGPCINSQPLFRIPATPSTPNFSKDFGNRPSVLKLSEAEKKTMPIISKNKLSIFQSVGEGGFGTVKQGILNGNGDVAVKQPKATISSKHLASFKQEALALNQLKHKNVMKFHGVVLEQDTIVGILIEFMPSSLFDLIHKYPQGISSVNYLSIAQQIAAGLQYIHSCCFIHSDIKEDSNLLRRFVNTLSFSPPGVIIGKQPRARILDLAFYAANDIQSDVCSPRSDKRRGQKATFGTKAPKSACV